MESDNVQSLNGKVHKVLRIGKKNPFFVLACNKNFNLGIDGFIAGWRRTTQESTCLHCSWTKRPDDTEAELTRLGNDMRAVKTSQLRSFLRLSRECEYRRVTRYRQDVNGKKYHAFKCMSPKLIDIHFGWACGPSCCPYIGHLKGCEWDYEIEKKPTASEIKEYERIKHEIKKR